MAASLREPTRAKRLPTRDSRNLSPRPIPPARLNADRASCNPAGGVKTTREEANSRATKEVGVSAGSSSGLATVYGAARGADGARRSPGTG
jgi:hypothetical protein